MKLGLTYHLAFDFRQAHQAYEEGFALWQRAGETQPTMPLPPAPHALRVDWEDPLTLDPAMVAEVISAEVIGQLFSGLVALSPELDVVPEVARTWEVLEGGRTYVFHLQDDMHWSDGAPVTAGDFVYALRRVLDPATGSPLASLLYDIKGARAFHQGQVSDPDRVGVRSLDEVTLVIELEGPTGYFLHLLTYCISYPVPRHVVKNQGQAWTEMRHIVANGPFRLEAWQRGQSMVLAHNPAYHGRFTGNVQRVELSLFPSAEWSARLAMYEADDMDILSTADFPPPEMARARQWHAGEYVSVPRLLTIYVGFDVSRPPFNDARVRRAFALATDRETRADLVPRGYVSPATAGFIPPGMPGHSVGIGLPYDPDQARQLLAETGYPGGRGFPIVDALRPADPEDEILIESLQAQWREILGVETRWEIMEWGTFLDRLGQALPPMFFDAFLADYPDPDNFLRVGLDERWTGWWHEAYAGLVEKARRITDQGERLKLYVQADRILVEEAAVMPLYYGRDHMLVKPWVRKFPISAIKYWFWKDVIIEPH